MNRAPLFQLGHVVATSNALRTIEEALGEATPAYLAALISRHARGDWGDIHPDDVGLNEAALEHGNRILSVYKDGALPVWIITEADRSVTTVLLPEDY